MIDLSHLKEISDLIVREITALNKGLLYTFPIARYIESIEEYPKISNYGYVSQDVKDLCNGIVKASNKQMLDLYHQLVLVNLILKAQHKIRKMTLPEDMKTLYDSNFGRIMKEIESRDYTGSYAYTHDKFLKDLAVSSLRMIPAGAQKIHLSGISRRFLLKKGVSQFVNGIIYMVFELGGFYPLYEMHSEIRDPELKAEFNEDGWVKFYMRVADLLKMQPDVKGVFSCSWYFDPELERISPRLVYLRRIVTDNGGKLFYLGSNSESIEDATLKSPTRRRAYEENKYVPTAYLLIWSRKKLISWADRRI
jgi:hypothetical protein